MTTSTDWLSEQRARERKAEARSRARERSYDLAADYDFVLREWWQSGAPGDRCPQAEAAMEDARAALVEATR